jgi:hypothetical protein
MRHSVFVAATLAIWIHASTTSAFVSFEDRGFLHPDAGSDTRYIDDAVDFATDGAGNWVAATTGPNVSVSSDNGVTWSVPSLVLPGGGAPMIWAYEPHVVTDNAGTWLLVWAEDPDSHGGLDAEVWISRSIDNGATWNAGVKFASNAATDLENDSRPRIATDGAGNWMAVWFTTDPVNDDADLMFTTSIDNGVTWSPVAWVDPLAPFETQDDNMPDVATDGAGVWIIAYNNNPTGNSTGRSRMLRSDDFGATWAAPIQVGTNLGVGALDIESSGPGVFASVYAGLNAVVSRTGDGGLTWSSVPVSGQLLSAQHRAHIATDGVGGWVAVWSTNSDPDETVGPDADIAMSRSSDDGENWTSPAFLNLDAGTDDPDWQNDEWPGIGTDGAGTWIVGWRRESLPDETDQDILFARSEPICPLVRRNDCIAPGAPGKGLLSIANPNEDEKDKVTVKLGSLGDTDKSDFGDPAGNGALALCHWDATGGSDRLVTQVRLFAGGTCDGRPCWKDTTPGYSYKDSLNQNGAMTKGVFKAGTGGKAKIKIAAKGLRIGTPVMPLDVDTSTSIQMISLATDVCWGASFGAPSKNEYDTFKAKSD